MSNDTQRRNNSSRKWSGLCFQQSPLDLYRFHPHQSLSPKGPQSCENSVPLTLTSFSQETQSITAGMWAGARLRAAGQPRGIHNREPGPGRGTPPSPPPRPPVHSCPVWEPGTHHIHLLLERLKGPQSPGPGEQRGLGEEWNWGWGAEKVQAELDRPSHQKKRISKAQMHTATDTPSHHCYSNAIAQIFHQVALRTGNTIASWVHPISADCSAKDILTADPSQPCP